VTGRRITRLVGLLVVLLGLAIAPATGAGAQDASRAVTTHESKASSTRAAGHHFASTTPATGGTTSYAGRRAHLGHAPLAGDVAPGSSAPGHHPGRRIAADPRSALHESAAQARCGRGPPAA
jgi:hypothetical protein